MVSSTHGAPSSICRLKGKIVVIDFGATWCGPCVAAFPHMREMVQRYKGLPVEFVGITSLQKEIFNPQVKKMVPYASPEEECKQMAEWCKRMKVTWNAWITTQDCFNPDYGVTGIPHVAIIGADGKVKHNGLSPHGADVENAVDAMLKDMGLTPPERTKESSTNH